MGWRFGIEKDSRGFQCPGGDDHDACIGLAMLAREAVNVMNAFGTPARLHDEIADDGVADQRELSGASRGRQGNRRAIEIRSGETSALALVAIVAGWPAVDAEP